MISSSPFIVGKFCFYERTIPERNIQAKKIKEKPSREKSLLKQEKTVLRFSYFINWRQHNGTSDVCCGIY